MPAKLTEPQEPVSVSFQPRHQDVQPRTKRAFARGKGIARLLDLALLVGLLAVLTGAVSAYLIHRASDKALHARIDATWRAAQAPIIARLNQPNAVEYDDVWGTRTGVVCGRVNGWGSFGGLSAMTPFYIWKGKPFFSPDISTLAFAPGWRECLDDHWVDIIKGGKPVGQRR